MLDLDTGVDLDEVVAVLLIDEELSGTSVAVVDRLGQLDGIVQDGIADMSRQVLGRSDFDDLLVSSLDGAVTLVEMDNVALVVTEELDLDVLGFVEEALDEDGAIAEGALGLGSGALKGFLQVGLLAHDTHTTTTTAEGSLDDDREAIFVSELLDLLKRADSVLGTRDDRNATLDGQFPGRDLVAELLNDLGLRANELQHVSVSSPGSRNGI